MRTKIFLIALIGIICLGLGGCQFASRYAGGDTTIRLEPNTKLEEVTWKDSADLWYLTRPMTKEDKAETHLFKQSSNFGVIEGTITIIESKK